MAGPEPHISIVIPTFNRARFIQDAVDSCYIGNVASSMVEVIVVDDGSTDDTSAILEELGDRCRHVRLGANQGRNRARNIGKSMATGRYVKFLDSDDVLLQGSLAVELAAATRGAGHSFRDDAPKRPRASRDIAQAGGGAPGKGIVDERAEAPPCPVFLQGNAGAFLARHGEVRLDDSAHL